MRSLLCLASAAIMLAASSHATKWENPAWDWTTGGFGSECPSLFDATTNTVINSQPQAPPSKQSQWLTAFDASTGTTKWSVTHNITACPMAIGDGAIFFPGAAAINHENGKFLWGPVYNAGNVSAMYYHKGSLWSVGEQRLTGYTVGITGPTLVFSEPISPSLPTAPVFLPERGAFLFSQAGSCNVTAFSASSGSLMFTQNFGYGDNKDNCVAFNLWKAPTLEEHVFAFNYGGNTTATWIDVTDIRAGRDFSTTTSHQRLAFSSAANLSTFAVNGITDQYLVVSALLGSSPTQRTVFLIELTYFNNFHGLHNDVYSFVPNGEFASASSIAATTPQGGGIVMASSTGKTCHYSVSGRFSGGAPTVAVNWCANYQAVAQGSFVNAIAYNTMGGRPIVLFTTTVNLIAVNASVFTPPTPVPPTGVPTPSALPTTTAAPSGAPSSCSQFTDCTACTTSPNGNCGFCLSTKTCQRGSATGPSSGSCPAAYWEWSLNQCS